MYLRSLVSSVAVLALCSLAPACGSDSESGSGGAAGHTGGTGGSTGGTGGSTGGTGGSTGGTGGSSGGAAGSSGAAGSGGAAGSSGAAGSGGAAGSAGAAGSGGASGANLVPSIDSAQFFVNCMPTVAADPVHGTFDAKYDNNTGTAADQATISKIVLHVTKGSASLDWTFTATPSSSGSVAAGASTTVQHTKDSGSGSGSGSPCSFCGGDMTLSVDWNTGSGTKSASSPSSTLTCAF
jgi:hypothetical protein